MSAKERGRLDGVRRDLLEVGQAVALARRTVQSGDFVDLAGLEKRITPLCGTIQRLPQSEGRTLEPQLLGLPAGLTQLPEEPGGQREQTPTNLAGTNPHQAAPAPPRTTHPPHRPP